MLLAALLIAAAVTGYIALPQLIWLAVVVLVVYVMVFAVKGIVRRH
ncbi:hypothetical protein [Ectobacillus ponti]|uniref:Uncharacterized protein n=1 Tax=Ectobacillus ponti TaxID=2961894 RepID=A0AA41XA07_9BACI|nr:hypothetical protein [Ectobacillus ponti]MCP8968161.1 hypothetical protein [Ectobacillus ponti]